MRSCACSVLEAADVCSQDADGELVGEEVCWLIQQLWEQLESPLQMSPEELSHEVTAVLELPRALM